MQDAENIMITLFPQSPSKFVVFGQDDGQAIDNFICYSDDFEPYFKRIYSRYNTINTIYIIGPDDYTKHFIDIVDNTVSSKVKIVKAG